MRNHTAFLVPNTAHILQFILCDLWSRPYTKYFQHRLLRLQYSAEGNSPAFVGISTIQWALYCKHGVKYSAHPPVYAIWIVDPTIYSLITAPHIQDSIFNWTCLLWYWRYVDKSMRLILQTLCPIQLTSSRLRYVDCSPCHIQCSYSSAYVGFNIQLNVSPLLLEICRHFDGHYSGNWVPNIAHMDQLSQYELWSRSYAMHLQLRIFGLQYSAVGICAAIVHITSIQ
jgi:hypothetical protein